MHVMQYNIMDVYVYIYIYICMMLWPGRWPWTRSAGRGALRGRRAWSANSLVVVTILSKLLYVIVVVILVIVILIGLIMVVIIIIIMIINSPSLNNPIISPLTVKCKCPRLFLLVITSDPY